MAAYTKRAVTIEARQWPGDDPASVITWMLGYGTVPHIVRDALLIPTLEGAVLASPGDWVVRGVHDEFYPVKPEIFEKTYEPARTPATD